MTKHTYGMIDSKLTEISYSDLDNLSWHMTSTYKIPTLYPHPRYERGVSVIIRPENITDDEWEMSCEAIDLWVDKQS